MGGVSPLWDVFGGSGEAFRKTFPNGSGLSFSNYPGKGYEDEGKGTKEDGNGMCLQSYG